MVALAVCSLDEPTLAQGLGSGTRAVLLTEVKDRLVYSGVDGWIQVSYVVQTDGTVANVLVEDSFGPASNSRTAVRTMSRWKYKPATWMGLPVPQSDNRIQYWSDIQSGGDGSARREFVESYRRLQPLINQGDLAAAGEEMSTLERQSRNLYEFTLMSQMQARLATKAERHRDAARYLQRVTNLGERYLDRVAFYQALRELFFANVEAGMPADALFTYALIRTQPSYKEGDSMDAVAGRIAEALSGAATYTVDAEIPDYPERATPFWDQQVLRQEIGFADIEGTLTEFQLRCDRRVLVDVPLPEKRWTLEPRWGNCRLYVFGTAGTTFRVIEYPLSP